MKKTTDYDEETELYKDRTVRYFHHETLVLEVEDADGVPVMGEKVNIAGISYTIEMIVNYPEIQVFDIILK